MASPDFTAEELAREEWRVIEQFPNYAVSNLGRVRRETPGINTTVGRILRAILNTGYGRVMLGTRGDDPLWRSVHRLVAVAFLGAPPEGRPQVNHINGVKTDNRVENLEWNSAKEDGEHRARLGLAASGSRHGSKTHPERLARGDRSGARIHPERMPRGDSHGSRTKPERLARGERHVSRTHPELLARGEQSGRAKLTEADIVAIRSRHGQGDSLRAIARTYGVANNAIWMIVHRKSWAHVP